MQSVRKIRLCQPSYWSHQYAIVIMSHTKAGYPIVRSLLDLGMYVVAVAPHLKQNEMLRHLLSPQQRRRYFTKELDLHTLLSINMLIMELKLEVQQVKLFLILIPQIKEDEMSRIFDIENVALLQTIMEVNDLGVGAVRAAAKRHIMNEDYSHMWSMRFHHKKADLVQDYFEELMALGALAPRELHVNLMREKGED